MIGGYGVGTSFDSSRLVLLDGAGLDFVVNSDQGAPPSVASAFGDKLNRLRERRPGFTMQAVIYSENFHDRGALFKNRNPVRNRNAIVKELGRRGLHNPSVAGWMIWDEPPFDYGSGAGRLSDDAIFSSIRSMTRLMRDSTTRLGTHDKLALVNLMPLHLAWAFPARCRRTVDTLEAYRCYLDTYLSLFDRDSLPAPVLSFDNYPFELPTADLRRYFLQLAIVRDKAAQFSRPNYRIPFWSVIQASPRRENAWSPYQGTPTIPQIRWQAYVSIAYGAKGICYWTSHPIQSEPRAVGYGASFLRPDGSANGSTYAALKALNAELHALGPTLMALEPLAAYHVAANGAALPPGEGLLRDRARAHGVVSRITDASGARDATDALVGLFRHRANGSHHLLVVNKGLAHPARFRVVLTSPVERVERVDRVSGDLVPTALANGTAFVTPLVPPGGGVLYRIGPER
jgi:hypothetical protein